MFLDTNAKILNQAMENNISTQSSLSFSPDGQKLAWGGDQTQIWDVSNKRLLKTLPVSGPCAFSNDGRLLTRKIDDTALWLWPQ